jgi:hypothetical protein
VEELEHEIKNCEEFCQKLEVDPTFIARATGLQNFPLRRRKEFQLLKLREAKKIAEEKMLGVDIVADDDDELL